MILTEVDSSALGDGKSQRCARKASGLADRMAFSGRNSRKLSLDGTKYVPPGECSVRRIRSPFSLGPTPVPCSRGGLWRDLLPARSTVKLLANRNKFTIDEISQGWVEITTSTPYRPNAGNHSSQTSFSSFAHRSI